MEAVHIQVGELWEQWEDKLQREFFIKKPFDYHILNIKVNYQHDINFYTSSMAPKKGKKKNKYDE